MKRLRTEIHQFDRSLYRYDPNGNMTVRVEISGGQRITLRQAQGRLYTQGWDAENRLIAVTSTLGAIATTTFAYDAAGQRVMRSDISGTTVYIGQYYEVQLSTGITTSYYTFGGQRVAMRTGSSVRVAWLHGDHLGSASLTTDASGTVVSEMRYYPFGEVRWISGSMPTDHTFIGQWVAQDVHGPANDFAIPHDCSLTVTTLACGCEEPLSQRGSTKANGFYDQNDGNPTTVKLLTCVSMMQPVTHNPIINSGRHWRL